MALGDITASTISFPAGNEQGVAYLAKPADAGKHPSVVVIHHMPGWDEWTMEVCRKFAHHGFNAIAPHLFFRFGTGSPDDLAALARAAGGSPDDQVVADVAACVKHLRALPTSNGKVGVIGFCSGGRHAFLSACRLPNELDAIVDCWGGNVIVDDPSQINKARPVPPIEIHEGHSRRRLLGIFGNEDQNPSADQVNRTEEVLKKLNKNYEFHRYDGAGHGIFAAYSPTYRVAQAVDGWEKVMAFFKKTLA